MGDSSPRGRRMSTRTRSILFGFLAVVALAAVILGVGALTSPKQPDSSLPPVTKEADASRLYREAISALASGETTRATSLLQQAAAAGSQPARVKLEELKTSKPSKPQSISLTSTPPGNKKPPITPPTSSTDLDKGYTGVRDPKSMLPAKVAGFTGTGPDSTKSSAILPLEATARGPYDGKTSRVVLSVIDEGTTAKAAAYVDALGKAYPKQLKPVTVGIVPGKSGNDGSNTASVVFKRGRYVFEVVASTVTGDVSGVQAIALVVAKAFPASR